MFYVKLFPPDLVCFLFSFDKDKFRKIERSLQVISWFYAQSFYRKIHSAAFYFASLLFLSLIKINSESFNHYKRGADTIAS